MNMYKAVLFALVLMVSSTAMAGPTAYPCDNCTEANYHTAAVNKARGLNQGAGFIYIYDLTHSLIRKFQIEREPGPNGAYIYYATAITPSSSEAADFTAMSRFSAASGRTMRGSYAIDPLHAPPGSPTFPQQVTDYINNPYNNYGYYGINVTPVVFYSLTNYVTAYLNNLEGFNLDPLMSSAWDYVQIKEQQSAMEYTGVAEIGLTIAIRFPNMGSASITLSLIPGTRPAAWKIIRMIDKNGNPVPLSKDEAATSNGNSTIYDFNNDHTGLANFEYYLSNGLHIPTYHVGGWTVACVKTPVSTTCTAQPN